MIANKIKVTFDVKEQIKYELIPTEFKHIIINMISNAKDAFIDNEIQNRAITIKLDKDNDNIRLEVSDNAGGIPNEMLDKVFEPNITSKKEGTGIGLYMSSLFIDKIGGKILLENITDNLSRSVGAKFTILLPL